MLNKLSNEIIDMKISEGEGNLGQRPYKPIFKINPSFKEIEPPLTSLNINLRNVASNSFCTYHQEKHFEMDYPQWVHAMNLMANQFLDEVSLTEQSSDSSRNIVDQEEVDPLEETTMMIWDPNLPMPSDDVFEVQEPPTEVLDMKTRSRGHLVSNDLAHTSRGKQTVDHSKESCVTQRNPINIHTRESPKVDYNIVENMKKLKANISIMDMCRIPQQKEFMLQELKSVENPTKITNQGENPALSNLRNKPIVNSCYQDKKGNHFVPLFLLTFEVFNENLHNCLFESGESSNIMSLYLCKKINTIPLKSDKHVIQLNKTQVKVMGELKYVMIRMATHPKKFQVIDITVVDIP
jgi:hypothetical protein